MGGVPGILEAGQYHEHTSLRGLMLLYEPDTRPIANLP